MQSHDLSRIYGLSHRDLRRLKNEMNCIAIQNPCGNGCKSQSLISPQTGTSRAGTFDRPFDGTDVVVTVRHVPCCKRLWKDACEEQKNRSRKMLELLHLTPSDVSGTSCGHIEMVIATAVELEANPINKRFGAQPFAILLNVYVAPGHRNSGVGTTLLQKACEYASTKPVVCMVQEDNFGARRFYERFGFYEICRPVVIHGDTFFVLEYTKKSCADLQTYFFSDT